MRKVYHFEANSITQKKKALGLQFSADNNGMLSMLEPMLVPYLTLVLIGRFGKARRSILDRIEIEVELPEPLNRK
jgi:hypothetical protein